MSWWVLNATNAINFSGESSSLFRSHAGEKGHVIGTGRPESGAFRHTCIHVHSNTYTLTRTESWVHTLLGYLPVKGSHACLLRSLAHHQLAVISVAMLRQWTSVACQTPGESVMVMCYSCVCVNPHRYVDTLLSFDTNIA